MTMRMNNEKHDEWISRGTDSLLTAPPHSRRRWRRSTRDRSIAIRDGHDCEKMMADIPWRESWTVVWQAIPFRRLGFASRTHTTGDGGMFAKGGNVQ